MSKANALTCSVPSRLLSYERVLERTIHVEIREVLSIREGTVSFPIAATRSAKAFAAHLTTVKYLYVSTSLTSHPYFLSFGTLSTLNLIHHIALLLSLFQNYGGVYRTNTNE